MHDSINKWEGEGGALAPRTLEHPMPVYVAVPDATDGPPDARPPSSFALRARHVRPSGGPTTRSRECRLHPQPRAN